MYEKLEKKAPTRLNNHELLGQSLIDAGTELGPGTAYGAYDIPRHKLTFALS